MQEPSAPVRGCWQYLASQASASCSSTKYLTGHAGRGSPRGLCAMTISTGVLPRSAKAETVVARLQTATASLLTPTTPVISRRTATGSPPVMDSNCSRAHAPPSSLMLDCGRRTILTIPGRTRERAISRAGLFPKWSDSPALFEPADALDVIKSAFTPATTKRRRCPQCCLPGFSRLSERYAKDEPRSRIGSPPQWGPCRPQASCRVDAASSGSQRSGETEVNIG